MNFVSELDEKTSQQLEAIYNYSKDKWSDKSTEKTPTKLGIVKTLIKSLYETLVEEGELE